MDKVKHIIRWVAQGDVDLVEANLFWKGRRERITNTGSKTADLTNVKRSNNTRRRHTRSVWIIN